MSKRKLMTIDDLVKFCREQNFTKFSSKETGYALSVQVPAQFEINKEQNDDSLLFCLVKLMHSGENRNHSSVTDDALVKASKTLAYKPILANFVEYTDPNTNEKLVDFTSHDMEITEDGDIIYYERQIGCFTSDEPYFEVEDDTGHNFLYGYCAIPREYSAACSVIERKNGTKVSVELEINEMQYSAKNKVLELTDVNILGATCLGKDPDTLENVEEGMKNARLDIADFSIENNSVKFSHDEKLIEMLERLNTKIDNLSNFTIEGNTQQKLEEGGNKTVNNRFKELLEQYGKTVENITFKYENLSDEELETKFAEIFGDEDTDGEGNADPEPTSEGDEGEGVSNEGDNTSEKDNGDKENTNDEGQFSEKLVRTYEISHEDIRYSLYNLLALQEDTDNEWYFINSVYDDHFTYENWSGEKIYGQAYAKKDDNISFDGERWNLHRELLTDSEYVELMSMRQNYAALVQFKEDTENTQLHSQREAILYDEKYSVLAERNKDNEYKNEAYAKLVSEMDNYSLVDLEKELKSVFADYITNGGQFAYIDKSEVKTTTNKKLFTKPTSEKPSRYGNLFNKQ